MMIASASLHRGGGHGVSIGVDKKFNEVSDVLLGIILDELLEK